MVGSWSVHGRFMVGSWSVHGRFMVGSWPVLVCSCFSKGEVLHNKIENGLVELLSIAFFLFQYLFILLIYISFGDHL